MRKMMVALVICSPILGCSGGGSSSLTSQGEYKKIATEFGEALQAGNYAAAWAMTSNRIRNRMSYELFGQDFRDARNEYGEILRIEVFDNELDEETLNDEDIIPNDIPKESVRAWMTIELALELDQQGEVERCYDYWLILVEEEGQIKIADYYHEWCD
jgi:hypothetical protein